MKRKVFLIFCFSLLILVFCDSLKLTEEEAMRLIREDKGYPKLDYIRFGHTKGNSKLGKEIKRLVAEGYIEQGGGGYVSLLGRITEKGENIIYAVQLVPGYLKNPNYYYCYFFYPYTHKLDIKRITEILIDKDNKTALVKYEIAYFPTDYYHKLIEVDKKKVERIAMEKNKFLATREIGLKKWDKGWRVMK